MHGVERHSGGDRNALAKPAKLGCVFLFQRCGGMAHAALSHDISGATLAGAAAGGDAKLKLDVVKTHAGMRMASNVAVRNTVANTDDHVDHS